MRPRAFLLRLQRISTSLRTFVGGAFFQLTFPAKREEGLRFPHPPATPLSQVVVGEPEDQFRPLLAPPLAEEGVADRLLGEMLRRLDRHPLLPEVERGVKGRHLLPTTVAAMRQVGGEVLCKTGLIRSQLPLR